MCPFISLLFVHWLKVKYIEIVLINKAMKNKLCWLKKAHLEKMPPCCLSPLIKDYFSVSSISNQNEM